MSSDGPNNIRLPLGGINSFQESFNAFGLIPFIIGKMKQRVSRTSSLWFISGMASDQREPLRR